MNRSLFFKLSILIILVIIVFFTFNKQKTTKSNKKSLPQDTSLVKKIIVINKQSDSTLRVKLFLNNTKILYAKSDFILEKYNDNQLVKKETPAYTINTYNNYDSILLLKKDLRIFAELIHKEKLLDISQNKNLLEFINQINDVQEIPKINFNYNLLDSKLSEIFIKKYNSIINKENNLKTIKNQSITNKDIYILEKIKTEGQSIHKNDPLLKYTQDNFLIFESEEIQINPNKIKSIDFQGESISQRYQNNKFTVKMNLEDYNRKTDYIFVNVILN